jgi:hypothetical protein
MFGTIRRHQKWLWIVISTLTIISFVAYFSPQRRRQGGWSSPHDYVGSIDGRPINREEYASIYHEAELRYLFSYGEWPGNDAMSRQSGMLEREVRSRFLLVEEIKKLHIDVGEAAAAKWIADNAAFHDRNDNHFRLEAYEQFTKRILPEHGLSELDFERFARHEVGIQHLVALAGVAGKLVTPQEAEALFRRENEDAEAEVAFVSSSNYLAQVTVNPTVVAAYYTNQQALYRIPERIQVSYVKFAASNYLANAEQTLANNTNLNQAVEATYLQRGTNSFKDASGATLSPEAAKHKIRDDLRENLALEEARTNAVEFANELFQLKDKQDALEKLAAAKGLVSQITEPFSQYEPPKDLRVPTAFVQAAARLTPEEPFAEQPIQADDGVYIMELKRRIPSEVPPLDSIREKVTQDYQNSKALELARAAGKEIHAALTNGLAQGKTFQAVASEKGANVVVLPAFSRKTTTVTGLPNRADSSQVISTAFSLAPGKISDFVPTRNGGDIVYLKAITPVSDATMKAELPEFMQSLRQSREYEAFLDWFRKQMELARISLPGDKQRASVN